MRENSKFQFQGTRMQIQTALAKFVLQLDADGRSRHTIRQYQRHIGALQRWLVGERHDGHVEKIDHEVLAQFLTAPAARARPDTEPKKTSSVNALRTSMRCFFAYTEAAGIVPKSPARLVRRAKCGAPLPRAMSDADQTRLLHSLGAADGTEARRDHALFALMLGTGVRLGSALGLDVSDLDLEQGEMLIHTKGDREQRVVLPAAVRDQLRAFLAGRTTGPVFPGKTGTRISARHVQRRLAGWCAQAGVARRIAPHSLRHTYATDLYARTRDVLLVGSALGHRAIASTMVYLRAHQHGSRHSGVER